MAEDKDKKGMIVFTKFSPYTVVDTKIENYKGEEYETPRTVSLCRCGHSKNKPFCDGTHARGVEFNNEREEEKTRGIKGYNGEKIVVYFDKYICKHAAKCVKGYPEVFNPDKIPWIEMKNATDIEKLIKVIKSCPSGALSYQLEGGERETIYHDVEKITIEKNGSINITGGVKVIDDNSSEEILDSKEHYSLCRCGHSKHKPFCDGTHARGVEFNNEREEEKTRGIKGYNGEKIVVYFDKYICKHAAKCVKGYPEVFNPDKIPWIEMKNATDIEKLIKVIKSCPSGALSYQLEGGERETIYHDVEKITIEKNGSINITGGVKVIDDNSSEEILDSKEHYSLCRCGHSKHKPFCDGTHKHINFNDEE